jgi:hypothetical protein
VEPLGARQYRVALGGAFRFGWMAALCGGLAARKLSIERAHAQRGEGSSWRAELELYALPGAADAERVSYVELAQVAAELEQHRPIISASDVVPSLHAGGTLALSLEAEDSLGLLGSLLGAFAGLMLFPVEMDIQTIRGRAHDRFWLAGVGVSAPSHQARAALERMLETWTVSKRV